MSRVGKVRRPRTLTLDAILDESLRIISRQGVGGLTMRAVAAELGVTPMAVYYYVADKDDLLRLVVDRVNMSNGLLQWEPDEQWQTILRAHLVSTWEGTSRYPGLSAHVINSPGLGVTPDRLEAGLAFFEHAGFEPGDARLAWSFALTYIHGRLSVDAHLAHRPDAPHLDGLRAPDYVEFGVDSLIRGLETMLDRSRRNT